MAVQRVEERDHLVLAEALDEGEVHGEAAEGDEEGEPHGAYRGEQRVPTREVDVVDVCMCGCAGVCV